MRACEQTRRRSVAGIIMGFLLAATPVHSSALSETADPESQLVDDTEAWLCYFSPDIDYVRYRFAASVPSDSQYRNVTWNARVKWNDRATDVKFAVTSDVSVRNVSVHKLNSSQPYWAWVSYSADRNIGDCASNHHLWLQNHVGVWFNHDQMYTLSLDNKSIVAGHEFGHALGLGHPPDQLQGMNCIPANPRPSIMYQGELKLTYFQLPRSRDVTNVNSIYF